MNLSGAAQSYSAVTPPKSALQVSTTAAVFWVSVWCLLVLNGSFWSSAAAARGASSLDALLYLAALGSLAFVLIFLFLILFAIWPRLTRPMLTIVLLSAAATAYFSDTYGVLIDKVMIRNVLETDATEATELITARFLLYLGLLGVAPVIALWRISLRPVHWRLRLQQQLVAVSFALLVVGLNAALLYKDHASFLRNHRELRHLLVPVNVMAGTYSHLRDSLKARRPYRRLGLDARRRRPSVSGAKEKPIVIVLVIGETARAANFSLDGYSRNTTPRLSAVPELVNFSNVRACGTSTAVSVPCLFSDLGHDAFDPDEAKNRDNLLDIVARAGVKVSWFGNNTDCKGVCRRSPEIRVDPRSRPDACEAGLPCRDGALFDLVQAALTRVTGPELIVIHTLGSHGPGYHLRYPAQFEIFKPACRQVDFSSCRVEEVVNAYDNTILYTDHLLAETIETLKKLGDQVDTALLYVSDHGESLGENGVYLHALPYAVAPDVQTKVPMVFWASAGFRRRLDLDLECLRDRAGNEFTHDNVFHSMLGLLEIETSVRRPAKDLFAKCR